MQHFALGRGASERVAIEHLEGVIGFYLPLEVHVEGENTDKFTNDVVRNLVVFCRGIKAGTHTLLGVELGHGGVL